MFNPLPECAIVSPETDFRTVGDFNLIMGLFNNGPYRIPAALRDKVIQSAGRALSSDDPKLQMIAGRLLTIMDKLNFDLAKAAMPKRIEHFNAKALSDDDLESAILKSQVLLADRKGQITDASIQTDTDNC